MDTPTPTTARTPGIVIGRRLRIPASALTLDGFRRWAHSPRFPERAKASFVNGEVHLEMSPEELLSHNSAKGDIFAYLWSHVTTLDLGQLFADRALLINPAAELATEPDIMFCRWESFHAGRVQLQGAAPGAERKVELHGSPDLVIEIVSRSSAKKDLRELRNAYHRAEIPEYWIVDARRKDILFRLLKWQADDYAETEADDGDFRTSHVLSRRVRLTRSATQIGGWRYRLEIAE